ncbi:MAG: OsmC family protein [Candidatus Thorarchaeota archaeon]|nr:OsmC family protein [Candidatus Thorarchaeota archaeon]
MAEEHRYQIRSKWIKDRIVEISISQKPDFRVAPPLDFWSEAPADLLSPEDLFVASAVSCYGVTLVGTASRFHAEFTGFTVSGTGTLKKGEYGWEFDEILIDSIVSVKSLDDKAKMEKAAERAHRYCLVSNSMKCPVRLRSEVIVVD